LEASSSAETQSPPDSTGQRRSVHSTAYCLTSRTASGGRGYDGSVAMNNVPLGSKWYVHTGPMAGRTFTVNDRIGSGSQFDIWMSTCDACRQYGSRNIEIERVE
jgi:3D (Asp-Asp-Asp) domain-containing protein